MPEQFILDSCFTVGKTYTTDKREALIINAIGTNGTDFTNPPTLVIDDKPTGPIINYIAPLHKINTNFLPLLDLGRLYYVVPPETNFYVKGATGNIIRCKGSLLKLAPGETLPTEHLTRFTEQPIHYYTFLRNTYSHGTDVALPADAEVTVISHTPKTIEKVTLNGYVMAKVSNYTPSEEKLAVRFYLDNVPKDIVLLTTKTGGIDIMNLPYPPTNTAESEPFTLKDSPIEVLGDHTLEIKVRNISGAAISPAAGTSLIFDILVVAEYLRSA
jgi:hypothetical protein